MMKENAGKFTLNIFILFFLHLLTRFLTNISDNFWLKEVFSKPSVKHIHCWSKSLFFKLETSNLGYLLIFSFY